MMADKHGNVRAYGERECSVQRRNQKLVEEAPSVAVSPELRKKLCDAAIAAAKSCGYQNAGTVEFLLDKNGEFYFLEVNARLQVEHPVTELVYNVDLVKQQLEVAAGEPLPALEGTPEPNGWAIECRINGENPYMNFMPSLGLVEHVEMPLGPGTRFDTMLFDGLDVPVFYDSLLGKLIVWAEDRDLAIKRMRRALHDLLIAGIDTNAPFHLALLDNEDFQTGRIHTSWLESSFKMPAQPEDDPRARTALIAAALAAGMVATSAPASNGAVAGSRWLRAGRADAMQQRMSVGGGRGWRRGIASS
jgi:acetyl-CoA carboxylase biotin carboxylase subunit